MRRIAAFIGATLLCVAAGGAVEASARTRVYAVVVAQNRSLDAGVPPLRYADDDGIRTFELLSLFADSASLFVVPDEETARLHPKAARRAEVPERAAILARLRQLDARMAKDVARGDEPELFFVYAGHGDVDASGQGYVNLHDGRLTRADLFREVIAPSKARYVHVIIDACKSYFMVKARGGRKWVDDADDDGRTDARLRAFLAEERLRAYPRAGVIVATSGDQDTHEWSRYRGGILSHQLRSALAGAADVNDDGRVEYSELRAFLAAANARVRLPQARIDVFSRPPASDRRRALVDLRLARRRGRVRLLRFGASMKGRFHVEDERGVRYADFNKEAGSTFDLAVDSRRAYFVRRDDREEVEVRASGPRRVDLGRSPWTPTALSSRGAVEESFRRDLYQVAYGPRFYEGYVARSGDLPVEGASPGGLRERAERAWTRHSLTLGYGLSGPPAGNAGLSHSGELRYAFQLRSWLDLHAAVEVGLGGGRATTPSAASDLQRTAVLFGAGFTHGLGARLWARVDGALGWQLLRGTTILGGALVTGAEGRGLRFEVGVSLGVDLVQSLAFVLRGGFALDGVYPADVGGATTPSALFSAGLRFRF